MMLVAEFLRFYRGYTLQDVLNEYAKSFFSLCNAMSRLVANERLDDIAVANADEDLVVALKEQSGGISEVVRQVRNVK